MKYSIFSAALTLAVSVSAAAFPKVSSNIDKRETASQIIPEYFTGSCSKERMTIRKEWRHLTANQQNKFLDAVQCLMDKPAKSGLTATTSRFSDLQALHRGMTNAAHADIIHHVVSRPLLVLTIVSNHYVERANSSRGTATTCTSTRPYSEMSATILDPYRTFTMFAFAYFPYTKLRYRWWDEQKDADSGNMWQSSMWGPDAFGGNGTGPDLCVTDGRFANYTLHIGPGDEDTDYCLRRAWDNENAIANANSTALNNCNAYNTFSPWWDCISNIPHKGVHTYIGGVVRINF